MKKNIGFILVSIGQLYLAQNQFEIRDGSKQFDARITVQNCEGDTCSGEGVVELINKKSSKISVLCSLYNWITLTLGL